ncbi:hypothetical protein VOLCADRAFT_100933 [Volvox carteri f. nagariensis]|uniref:Uncharacterized protein n=1 Tax=Volvox carteri f. nagariensis TaxID=3068 RepID=D8ULD1_VOLCA|nr:uncharacterized protein VOLCADRAFT_100933 [Volvox carteri f. nagariensis]EFJ39468.1 hypothetical protein VOLCADRAFT_100933 [Volvox carteri f. nagariensis]|eukprot:XP_002959467.1 hypothetical protein VOLCADRAFT_100933 [Volvox carteri f. nagariensis]
MPPKLVQSEICSRLAKFDVRIKVRSQYTNKAQFPPQQAGPKAKAPNTSFSTVPTDTGYFVAGVIRGHSAIGIVSINNAVLDLLAAHQAGPTKFATKIACISEQATAAYDMEVAMMAMPTPYVQLWKQAAQQRQPLYSINGRITQKDKWQPVVWLGGVLVTAAYPSKVVRRWVDLASAAIDDQQLPQSVTTTASTGPSTYTHPVLAWERRNATAVVLPADGTHKDMRLQPNLMLEVSVDQQPVIPLVLHRGDNTATYPVCASELAVLQQLPGFQDFFADQDFATTESRQQYVTEEQWTLHCDVKTTTHGRTTFVTDIRPI